MKTVDGCNVVEFLPWDSDFFDFKTGKMTCIDALGIDDILAIGQTEAYKLLYIFSSNPIEVPYSGSCRLLDVGGQVTYRKRLRQGQHIQEKTSVTSRVTRYRGAHDNNALIDLAYLSGKLSRFRVDPLLPSGSFERLYSLWLLNSLRDEELCCVLTAGPGVNPDGMLTATWKKDSATIDLLAVREDAQCRGIGSALMSHLEHEALGRDVTQLFVKTQMINRGARRAYERNGYILTESSYVYHIHL